MFLGKNHEQTILEIAQGDYIAITAESFLIDRQVQPQLVRDNSTAPISARFL